MILGLVSFVPDRKFLGFGVLLEQIRFIERLFAAGEAVRRLELLFYILKCEISLIYLENPLFFFVYTLLKLW